MCVSGAVNLAELIAPRRARLEIVIWHARSAGLPWPTIYDRPTTPELLQQANPPYYVGLAARWPRCQAVLLPATKLRRARRWCESTVFARRIGQQKARLGAPHQQHQHARGTLVVVLVAETSVRGDRLPRQGRRLRRWSAS